MERMMAVQHAVTLEEFEDFIARPENAEWHFELIYGEIVRKMPTILHGIIVMLIGNALLNYLRENPIGRVVVEGRYRLPNDRLNDIIPDLSFIIKDKAVIAKGAAPYMPDLAVEVQSPDQSDKFMVDKAAYSLANGTRAVWLVYPEKRLVEVLTLNDRQLLTEADTLSGELLPGFSLSLRSLFADA